MLFLAVLVWSEIRYQFRLFWSELGYGLCTLVLNWVCFLEELATSSPFGDKTISLLMCTPTGQYKTTIVDCGLRTTDCGLGIKHGLGIKCGLRTEYKTRTKYKTRTTDYVYSNSFRKVKLREKESGLAQNSSPSSLPPTQTFL